MTDLFRDEADDWDSWPVPAQISAGVFDALAELDTEDGSFHPPGTEGVLHHGFDRDRLARQLTDAGFVDVELDTACVVHRDEGVAGGRARPPRPWTPEPYCGLTIVLLWSYYRITAVLLSHYHHLTVALLCIGS